MPLASRVAKVKGPLAPTASCSPPRPSTTVPARPLTVPPIAYVVMIVVLHETAIFVTFAVPTVPLPFATLHVCPLGDCSTVTE